MRPGLLFLAVTASLVLVAPKAGQAQWIIDGRALCTASADQRSPTIVSDGAGGAIVTWQDARNGATDIYAQHVLASGAVDPGWPADGRALCTAADIQITPTIVADGAGGAIVSWVDNRLGGIQLDIYAQHVLASGAVDGAWPADGRALCTATGNQSAPSIASDGAGGAIVTWMDFRSGPTDIYAQHVLSSGAVDPGWPLNGRDLCTAAGDQVSPQIISAGAGGAIVTWKDARSGIADIYAQHVLSTSAVDPAWPADGRALCTAVNTQEYPTIVSDGVGGAIVTWHDHRLVDWDIYAQHVLPNGTVDGAWPLDGRALCHASNDQLFPTIVSDGAGGAIVTWKDARGGVDNDIYAQHVLSTGAVDGAWPLDGRALCTATGEQQFQTIVSDGFGGAIVTWMDARVGSTTDIYAQHVLASGAVDGVLPPDGRALCTAASAQQYPQVVSDGSGGAIVAWEDGRLGGTEVDIYAQRIYSCGEVAAVARCRLDGDPVCTAVNAQESPAMVSDGAGGAIVTWYDFRNGNYDIYAQHVLSTGAVDGAWPFDGRALCVAASNQFTPAIVSDGAGGAIVAWTDFRSGNYDIYAQHVLSSGAVDGAWPPDGRALCTAADLQVNPTIVSDGASGAIITWSDRRGGSTTDIYAQHVLSTGVVDGAWPVDGRGLCTAVDNQEFPTIVSDGAGGAIVTWQDFRSGTTYDIYAQRALSTGVVDPAWPSDGRAIRTAAFDQNFPMLVSDGAGGAIITWQDFRSGTAFDIYAQHVLSNGLTDVGWPLDGRGLCTAANDQRTPTIVSDGAAGAIVTWKDARSGAYDIYAQHVLSTGAVDGAWPLDGRGLCTAANEQSSPMIVVDGASGAIVTWQDYRSGAPDIYAQHVSSSGAVDGAWPVDGRALCIAVNDQTNPAIVANGTGGAMVAWKDSRYAADIYAQRVTSSGQIVAVAPGFGLSQFRLLSPYPNPARDDRLTIRFELPSAQHVSAWIMDLAGRRVRSLAQDREFTPGSQALVWDGRDRVGSRLPNGVYFVRVRAGAYSDMRRIVLLH